MANKNNFTGKVKRFFRMVYLKLFRINDTPHKIALGAGLGVFSGIMPGTGPIAAVCLAFIFRVNRAAALLGSLLTNTWLSFVTFIFAIKTGSAILGTNWRQLHEQWLLIFAEFRWLDLFKASFFKIILPVIIGYIIVGFCLGLICYLFTLILLKASRGRLRGTFSY